MASLDPPQEMFPPPGLNVAQRAQHVLAATPEGEMRWEVRRNDWHWIKHLLVRIPKRPADWKTWGQTLLALGVGMWLTYIPWVQLPMHSRNRAAFYMLPILTVASGALILSVLCFVFASNVERIRVTECADIIEYMEQVEATFPRPTGTPAPTPPPMTDTTGDPPQ
jgi:hypothetical protein